MGGARGGGIIFGLTRLPIRGFQTSMLILIPSHPFLCLVAGWLDLILIFRLPHNIWSRLTVGERLPATRVSNRYAEVQV